MNEFYTVWHNFFIGSTQIVPQGFDFAPFYLFPHLCSIWQFPLLYQEGVKNILFSWRRILGWMFNGLCSATIIFFFCTKALDPQSFNSTGKVAGYQIVGATMYTCVVCVVACQMALVIRYFTLIQHFVVWGELALWFLFLLVYGFMPPRVSTTAYKVLVECLVPSPSFWLSILVVVISALIPYYLYSAILMRFFPLYHERIWWMSREGQSDNPKRCDMVQQGSIGLTNVGPMTSIAVGNNGTEDRIRNHT